MSILPGTGQQSLGFSYEMTGYFPNNTRPFNRRAIRFVTAFFGLALAAWLLNEEVRIDMLVVKLEVILCVAGTKEITK